MTAEPGTAWLETQASIKIIAPERKDFWKREEIRDDALARHEPGTPLIWELPGQGFPGKDCGEEFQVQCSACGHLTFIQSTCGERICPDCFRSWAWEEAFKAEARLLLGARHYTYHYGARHVVVSPPQDPLPGTRVDLGTLRASAHRVLKTMGHRGGAMVFHPWRKKCGECEGTLDCETKKCPDHPRAPTSWEDGPHFHVVGYGAVNAEDREDGWVVRTLPRRKTVAGTIFYLLTHAGISYRSHALTWFGWWGYRALSKEDLLRVINGAGMLPEGESRITSLQAWADSQRGVTDPWKCLKCGGALEPVPKDSIHRVGWDQVLQIGGEPG